VFDGYYCKTGYEKSGSSCIAKIKTEDAYKKAETAYENKDYQTAFREFLVLAKTGNEKAQNFLGTMYEAGYGVTKDLKQAVSWFRKAANQGDVLGQTNLGVMYQYGDGVTKDLKQAFSWYQKAANQGYDFGQWSLGSMYEDGKGVAQNDKLAIVWYRKAANQGHPDAKKDLKALELKIKKKDAEAKTNIPENAYASSSDAKGWKCKTLYYENNNYCFKLPSNAIARTYGDGYYCKTGYIKSGNSCIKKINIPANAHSSGGSWICNTDFYRSSNLKGCVRVPENAYSSYDSNYWSCKAGYTIIPTFCIASFARPIIAIVT
jgi:TPR repeat protein